MADYREKVQQLSSELKKAAASLGSEKCTPITTIIVIAVPIVIIVTLFVLSPSFVMEKIKGEDPVRSIKKLLMWSTGLTAISWGCIYAYTKYSAGASSSVCVRD